MVKKAYKDSVTGEFVTKEYAAEHPDTTFLQTIHDPAESEETDGDTGQAEEAPSAGDA